LGRRGEGEATPLTPPPQGGVASYFGVGEGRRRVRGEEG